MFEYLHERGMNRYRVWCKGWASDQFIFLSELKFRELQQTVEEFSDLMTLTEHLQEWEERNS